MGLNLAVLQPTLSKPLMKLVDKSKGQDPT